jgi:hypothetical protein
MKGNEHGEYDEESIARAAQRESLTPAERALLRLAEGLAATALVATALVATALVAALPILAQALSDGALDWGMSRGRR